jgi:hypothetical protein
MQRPSMLVVDLTWAISRERCDARTCALGRARVRVEQPGGDPMHRARLARYALNAGKESVAR